MLISVLGFGSIWTRREAKPRSVRAFPVAAVAYYNTTGVLVGEQAALQALRLRRRPVQRQRRLSAGLRAPDGQRRYSIANLRACGTVTTKCSSRACCAVRSGRMPTC